MDAYEAALFVQAQACMARVAGMQAENEHRVQCGNSIAYGEDAFSGEAATLEHISLALPSCTGRILSYTGWVEQRGMDGEAARLFRSRAFLNNKKRKMMNNMMKLIALAGLGTLNRGEKEYLLSSLDRKALEAAADKLTEEVRIECEDDDQKSLEAIRAGLLEMFPECAPTDGS